MTLAYLDSSAFVKTIVVEPGSEGLKQWLERSWPGRTSCALLRTEAVRAVRPYGPDVVDAARRALRGLELIELDHALLDAAGDLPSPLRSLDAIHVAAALSLGPDLGVLVTYDERMARAAADVGIEVAAP